ncbi:MAG: NTP transferase domain-containing protein [Dehalococcoidia bacterium]
MRAVVLAAGDGGRLGAATTAMPKPLIPISGRPIVGYTLDALAASGVSDVLVVTGFCAEQLQAGIRAVAPAGMAVDFVFNPRFEDGASLSLRAAREQCGDSPFLLLMADHMLSPGILGGLLRAQRPAGPSLIATDAAAWPPDYIDEATRVRLELGGRRVTAIGKHLEPWDALDTGAFLLTPGAWAAVDAAPEDCELSRIFSELVVAGGLEAVDVSGASWYDIDTAADLEAASRLVAAGGAR